MSASPSSNFSSEAANSLHEDQEQSQLQLEQVISIEEEEEEKEKKYNKWLGWGSLVIINVFCVFVIVVFREKDLRVIIKGNRIFLSILTVLIFIAGFDFVVFVILSSYRWPKYRDILALTSKPLLYSGVGSCILYYLLFYPFYDSQMN
ncbi:uncharacterized protein LOC131036481 [Cryptomeria japonica]|uniref:uncharacterized protein LOC131036481 n=1 Tax=Cryptomeria japonica TaxID=3369 RepID=UPI0027D9E370|nr:uncharacterized protein LOC131036481 [Cryptomeria japonica]